MPNNKNNMEHIMEKALKSKVTSQVREEIASVLDINPDRMTAGQAVVYAQIAKAIKGDKSAFETVSSLYSSKTEMQKAYSVEIKVVE